MDNHDGYGTETYTQLQRYTPVYKEQDKCIYLATLVQNELIKSLGLHNRGVKQKNLSVCRETNAPTVLIETAFIDNRNEEQLLNDQSFQSKAAEAIKLAIDKYFAD
jgi:N-acetylmuramoyl-L-alanine amidase